MGLFILVVGLAILAFGLLTHFTAKRILSAPFKTTGDLALNASSPDPKGAMSTEGRLMPSAVPFLSPCSQTPCIAYELKVERQWEIIETTQDGTTKRTGSDVISTIKGGALVSLDDGSGAVAVDFSKGADFDSMHSGFTRSMAGDERTSMLQLGASRYEVPANTDSQKHTTGFKATERYVPHAGSLFVLGKLEGRQLVKPAWRSMVASSKGRAGLLGNLTPRRKGSFIAGGALTALSIPVMLLAPLGSHSTAPPRVCEKALTGARARCEATVSDTDGDAHHWRITAPGTFAISAVAPQKKISLLPELVVTNAQGEVLADIYGRTGGTATATLALSAGDYTLTVKPGDAYMVKGGFDYGLEIIESALERQPLATTGAEHAEPMAIDASMLSAAFLEDGQAAARRYEHQPLQVRGTVLDLAFEPAFTTVVLDVPVREGRFAGVVANLGPNVALKKGQTVTLTGVATIDDAGDPMVLLASAELKPGTPVAKKK